MRMSRSANTCHYGSRAMRPCSLHGFKVDKQIRRKNTTTRKYLRALSTAAQYGGAYSTSLRTVRGYSTGVYTVQGYSTGYYSWGRQYTDTVRG